MGCAWRRRTRRGGSDGWRGGGGMNDVHRLAAEAKNRDRGSQRKRDNSLLPRGILLLLYARTSIRSSRWKRQQNTGISIYRGGSSIEVSLRHTSLCVPGRMPHKIGTKRRRKYKGITLMDSGNNSYTSPSLAHSTRFFPAWTTLPQKASKQQGQRGS